MKGGRWEHSLKRRETVLLVDKTFNKLNESNIKFVADQQKPSSTQWMKELPKRGEGKQKLVSGDLYFWCGRCGFWNTTHEVDNCDKKSRYKKKKTKKSKSSDDDSASDAPDTPDDVPAAAEANYLSVDVSPEGDGWIFSPGYDQF